MIKTAKQIQGDIIALFGGSDLANALSGEIYRATPQSSPRPHDSKKEDTLVILTESSVEQIQSGILTINIYVPDVDASGIGYLIEDEPRCEQLELAAADWVASLTADKSDYRFALLQAICTEADPEINQHFIVIKLKYELLTI